MNSITKHLLNSSIDNSQNGFLNTKQGVLNTESELLNTNSSNLNIDNKDIGFIKSLGNDRFILSVTNDNELKLIRVDITDFVTNIDKFADHISSAINPKRETLEKILLAVQEKLSS